MIFGAKIVNVYVFSAKYVDFLIKRQLVGGIEIIRGGGLGIRRSCRCLIAGYGSTGRCRTKFPDAKIFGITKSEAVIKMSLRLGFKKVPYSALTTDPAFWKGCDTCPYYHILQSNNGNSCECQALLLE